MLKKDFYRLSKAATSCETWWPMFMSNILRSCLLPMTGNKSQQLAKTSCPRDQTLWSKVQYYLIVQMPEIHAAMACYASVSFTQLEIRLSTQLVAKYELFLDTHQSRFGSSPLLPITVSCYQGGISMQNIVTLLVVLQVAKYWWSLSIAFK